MQKTDQNNDHNQHDYQGKHFFKFFKPKHYKNSVLYFGAIEKNLLTPVRILGTILL